MSSDKILAKLASLPSSPVLGYKQRSAALARSKLAAIHPRTLRLHDGTFVGCGDTITTWDGAKDCLLYGRDETRMWCSEAAKAGLIDNCH